MRRRSWIDLLQQGSKIGKALAPEEAVVAHPIDQRREALGLGAIEHVAAVGALGDQTGQLQGLEVLGDGALRYPTPPRQLDNGDLVGSGNLLEHGSPSGIGKRAHDSIDGGGFSHWNKL